MIPLQKLPFPMNPMSQLHWYDPGDSWHVAFALQGLLSHSRMSAKIYFYIAVISGSVKTQRSTAVKPDDCDEAGWGIISVQV